MDFKAFLVKKNSTPALNIGGIGMGLFFVSIFFFAISLWEYFALVLAVSGIVISLIVAIVSRKTPIIEVDNQLISFNDSGIGIRSVFYSYSEIKDLQFYFHSFYSQSPAGYFTENAGYIEYGMSNTIRFTKDDVNIFEIFFLGNKDQADMFFILLSELKANGIYFDISYRHRN